MIPVHLNRILQALNIEKHLSARQLALLLYPNDNQKTAYERVIKQLQRLKTEKLLKSDHYKWNETLWSIAPHPINKEHGYAPPRRKIHSYKYDHEKACGDVFVRYALTDNLFGWEAHTKISDKIIPDRAAQYPKGETLYIEVEMGDADRVSEKIKNYIAHYRTTGDPFKVLFLMKQMRDWEAPAHYHFELLQDFLSDVPNDIPEASKG
jgi:hypothetical protein